MENVFNKRFFAALAFFGLSIGVSNAQTTWNIGSPTATDVTATFTVLTGSWGYITISGTGAMQDFTLDAAPPWVNAGINIICVDILPGVTSIGAYAFAGCGDITSAIITRTVTSIGDSAFYNCSSLYYLYICNPNPASITMGSNVFSGVNHPAGSYLIPPRDCVPAYQAAAQWQDFNVFGESAHTDTSTITVNIYTGTIMNGSQTAKYVYVPKYLNIDTNGLAQTIYADIFANVAPQYQTIMPDAKHLSTPMNGFLIYATAGDTVTLDAVANAAKFDSIMNLGKWSDITNAAAFFYPSATPVGTPQSSVNTANGTQIQYLIQNDIQFGYADGILIGSAGEILYIKNPELTITNQSLTVSDTTTGISKILAEKLQIYPSPVRDELKIESGELRIDKVEIVDLLGRAVGANLRVRPDEQGKHIGLSVQNLPSGVYFVKIETDSGVVTRKLIKE